MARLQFRAEGGLAGLLVCGDLPAPGDGEGVDLPFELLAASRHPGVPDLDLNTDERLGDEEFGVAGYDASASPGPLAGCSRIRTARSRAPGAVATVIDSQSVEAVETVGKDSRGCDGAKRDNGRKRHLVVDAEGLPLLVLVARAGVTGCEAAKQVLFRLRLMHPEITMVWAGLGLCRTVTG